MAKKNIKRLYKDDAELDLRGGLKNEILSRATKELSLNSNLVTEKNLTKGQNFHIKKWIPVVSCFAFLIICLFGYIVIFNEEYQTVYIDVNPSVAIKLNRFERVCGVEYMNDDANEVLNGTDLRGRSASDALEVVISLYDSAGYFDENAEIYISAVSYKNKNSDKLLEKLRNKAEKIKGNKNYSVDTAVITKEEKKLSEEAKISPGKYSVIMQVIEKYPEYTVEDLKDMKMSELKKLLNKNKK